ncbi:MAG: outer membrane lipoprotein chaperone LolA [Legionellaceae bacterium]|nr:outer membrane lipoprotein chaperone LolA [Legionellaceae bacterium]
MKKLMMIAVLLWAPYTYSDSNSDYLQTKLNTIRTMSASFSQVVKAKKRDVSRSSGTMALSRPGHFRWQTKRPMAQLVVADGSRLWVYDVELEQVSVKKQDTHVGGAAALFLSGYNDTMTRDFNVSMLKKNNSEYFDLQAKSNKANFDRVKLVFEGDELHDIELFDQLGQHTDVHLKQVKTNLKLVPSLFTFTVPKGVDVVQQ